MKNTRAFTLLELLVVVALAALLMGMISTSLQGVFQASALSEAVNQMETDLSLARQAASVTNREYEIRFLKFSDNDAARPESAYRGYQILVRDLVTDPSADDYTRPGTSEFDPPAKAIHAVRELPGGIVLLEDEQRSNLLTESSRRPRLDSIEIGDGVPASYTFFRFKPDGTTDLSKGTRWFATIAHEGFSERGDLHNLATLEVDPTTGTMKWHRP